MTALSGLHYVGSVMKSGFDINLPDNMKWGDSNYIILHNDNITKQIEIARNKYEQEASEIKQKGILEFQEFINKYKTQ
jgi:hypothetical protein